MNKFFATAAVVGTIGYATMSALHGNPPIDAPEKILHHVAERPWWLAGHLTNILAVVLWLIALSGFAAGVPARARPAGRAALAVMTCATAVFAVYFGLHGFGFSALADRLGTGQDDALFAQTDAVLTVLGSVAFTAQGLLGLSVALFGVTALASHRWLGIAGVVAGSGWLVGAVAVDFAVIVPFTVLAWIWMLGIGVVLWRRPVAAGGE